MTRRNIEITSKCPECKKVAVIAVPYDGYVNWKQGMLIQRAFPEMDKVQREMLISGYCGSCWDTMFKREGHER